MVCHLGETPAELQTRDHLNASKLRHGNRRLKAVFKCFIFLYTAKDILSQRSHESRDSYPSFVIQTHSYLTTVSNSPALLKLWQFDHMWQADRYTLARRLKRQGSGILSIFAKTTPKNVVSGSAKGNGYVTNPQQAHLKTVTATVNSKVFFFPAAIVAYVTVTCEMTRWLIFMCFYILISYLSHKDFSLKLWFLKTVRQDGPPADQQQHSCDLVSHSESFMCFQLLFSPKMCFF